jgi:tripartite-type tricarboxylate transporter receptor subunit TctC
MKLRRRDFLRLASASVFAAIPGAANADPYPSRPVRLIVTFPPGGALDVVSRVTGQWLSERFGQPFIIENRPGAGGALGIEAVANAAPDGHTLLMLSSANTMSATLFSKNNVAVTRDIVPIAGIVRVPNVMGVNPTVPARTVADFITYARANPGKMIMASGGLGTTGHMNGELFKMMTGIDMLHVPYRGGGPALADLIGGQVHVLFDPMPSSIEYVRSGKVRALAVTGSTRSEALPDVPTVGETVFGFETAFWVGIGGPKGIASDIVETLNSQVNVALADPKLRSRFAALGGEVLPGSPREFGLVVAEETEKWIRVARFAAVKPE